MLQLYTKVFISTLVYTVPMAVIMIIVGIWTTRVAKKRQRVALDTMKNEIAAEVVDSLKK